MNANKNICAVVAAHNSRPEFISESALKKKMIDRLMAPDFRFDVDQETGELLIPTGFFENAQSGAIQRVKDPNWGR